MGDRNESAACTRTSKTRIQVLRKPRNAFHIQMVRWFIQADNIRGQRKNSRQINTATLSARKCSNLSMQVDIREQTSMDIANCWLRCPFVFFKSGVHRVHHARVIVKMIALLKHDNA